MYLAFFGIFMLLQMSVSKILANRRLWCFETTKILQKWLQTWFILLHLVLIWNVRIKSIWTQSAVPPPPLCVQMNFTRTFQTTTKCNNINHVWSQFYKILVVLKYHRCPWANIFDTDICRSINIPKKAKYTTLM